MACSFFFLSRACFQRLFNSQASLCLPSLLAAGFFSKGHYDERLVIANAKGRYGVGLVEKKKARQGWYGRVGKKAETSRLITPTEFREKDRLPTVQSLLHGCTTLKKSYKLKTLGCLLNYKVFNTWDYRIKSNIHLSIHPAIGEKHLNSDKIDLIDIGVKSVPVPNSKCNPSSFMCSYVMFVCVPTCPLSIWFSGQRFLECCWYVF